MRGFSTVLKRFPLLSLMRYESISRMERSNMCYSLAILPVALLLPYSTLTSYRRHPQNVSVPSNWLLHILLNMFCSVASLTFSLITFGAAPVASFDINPILRQRSKKNSEPGLMVAIVNEYDIVPRVDGPYIRSLVDLYRDTYNLPPISDNPPSKQEVQYRPSIDVPDAGSHYQTSYSGKKNNRTQPEWSLPAPRYNLVGDIILLKMRLFPEVGAAVGAGTIAQPKFDAVKMSHQDFQRLIFCSTDVHKRTCYQARIEMIRKRAHDEFAAEKKELRWIPTGSTMMDSIEGSLNSGAEDDLDDDWVKYAARAIH